MPLDQMDCEDTTQEPLVIDQEETLSVESSDSSSSGTYTCEVLAFGTCIQSTDIPLLANLLLNILLQKSLMVKRYGKIVMEGKTMRDLPLILNLLPLHLHFRTPPLSNPSPKKLL